MLATILSIIALIATFYQLHLQRVHNEKSLKPLIQIDLTDRGPILKVNVQNNGVGPITIEKLIFTKDDKQYYRIQDCLTYNPRSYEHLDINHTNKKVLVPGGFLTVLLKEFESQTLDKDITEYKDQLSSLELEVVGRDIYDNKITATKSLKWFNRHSLSTAATTEIN